MSELLHQLVQHTASRVPDLKALTYRDRSFSYGAFWGEIERVAGALRALGMQRGDRIGVYLDKRPETVFTIFGAAAAGCVFVPVNPILKPQQVGYILADCNVRLLVTSQQRAKDLVPELPGLPDLDFLVSIDAEAPEPAEGLTPLSWAAMLDREPASPARVIDTDMVAILYTSGSTGNPKGVVLSHRNMVAGAKSVSSYIGNVETDRILSLLPLSFDAGLSQLTTAFHVGASVVLLNYLLPRDVLKTCAAESVTGLTGVPPLWIQLAELEWPEVAQSSIRYFANTGGHMPRATLDRLRQCMPNAQPFLMYGLTEAFRSTYLDPSEVDRRPDSIGKAIPNAEILVVRPDGTFCEADEPGELVHRGALVSLGYWNDPDRTAERFKPAPGLPAGLCMPEIAVWSGDFVRRDAEGFLYFVGRRDEMIKTSGYRVSPTEVEEILYASKLVGAAAALGIAHPRLGQAIVIVASPPLEGALDSDALLMACKRNMPQYMVPHLIVERATLPRNPNGKIDRKSLATEFADTFSEASS